VGRAVKGVRVRTRSRRRAVCGAGRPCSVPSAVAGPASALVARAAVLPPRPGRGSCGRGAAARPGLLRVPLAAGHLPRALPTVRCMPWVRGRAAAARPPLLLRLAARMRRCALVPAPWPTRHASSTARAVCRGTAAPCARRRRGLVRRGRRCGAAPGRWRGRALPPAGRRSSGRRAVRSPAARLRLGCPGACAALGSSRGGAPHVGLRGAVRRGCRRPRHGARRLRTRRLPRSVCAGWRRGRALASRPAAQQRHLSMVWSAAHCQRGCAGRAGLSQGLRAGHEGMCKTAGYTSRAAAVPGLPKDAGVLMGAERACSPASAN